MKHINKYNLFINENVNVSDAIDRIVDTMLEFIDDGDEITFYSASGEMEYYDYLHKNIRFQKFKPILKSNNKIISKFNIIYYPKNRNYNDAIDIMYNMKSTIGRLGIDGWVLSDFKSEFKGGKYGDVCKLDYFDFSFSKPDTILDEEFKLPDRKELRTAIEDMGIDVTDVDINDSEAVVEYDSYNYERSDDWYNIKFEKICNIFGFDSFESGRNSVIFIYNPKN